MNEVELKLIRKELIGLGLFDTSTMNLEEATKRAVMKFQRMNPPLDVDGIPGPRTIEALFTPEFDRPDLKPLTPNNTETFSGYPTQENLTEFYGAPGENLGYAQLPFELILAWDPTTTITRLKCNEKLIKPIESLFKEISKHYTDLEIAQIGLNITGGCFANRLTRGSKTQVSVHAHGAAIDVDPARNKLRWDRTKARLAWADASKFFDIVKDHGAISLGQRHDFDWMHIGWRSPG